ncbi:helix-turn-helix transcriptional regulator [Chitinolyticbacter albus]|nr:helix-turn-helix domain-containing protein [Chitinolyticbacter albus]
MIKPIKLPMLRYLYADDAARLLGISRTTLYSYVSRGRLAV